MIGAKKTVFVLVMGLALGCFTSCQSLMKSSKAASAPALKEVKIPQEVSLKEDRSQLDGMRQEVSEDVRRENDELALILGLMSKGDEEPSKVRERFNKLLRGKREKTDREFRKARENYTDNERKKRDIFLRDLKAEREEFLKRKGLSPQERREFFSEQDNKRNTYFADERDKRKEFESEITEKRREFEDYWRERNNEFNQEHRTYTTAYYERRKALDLKKRTEEKAKEKARRSGGPSAGATILPSDQDPMADFRNLPQVPVTPLGPVDDQ